MCGIVGIFKSINLDESSTDINISLVNLFHRGPDSKGIYVYSDSPYVLMGHTRLSIIDLSNNSNQPFETERSVTIFNGEIYNYEEIREELKTKGVSFVSEGDTEVISRGYDYWGMDIFKILKGMYAIAVFDKETKSLFMGRDIFGIKPLYFYQLENEIRFSSEIKALSAKQKYNLNVDTAIDLMTFGYQFSLDSIYEDIRQLKPGCVTEIWMNNGRVLVKEHSAKNISKDLQNINPNVISELTNLQSFKELKYLLQASVSRHLAADVPIAVSLSGGIDSSVIAALASNECSNTVAYTNTFNPDGDCEVEYAKLLCKSLNIEHRITYTKIIDLEAVLEYIAWHLEEPIPNIACLNTLAIGKAMKEDGFKIALLGEGADEIFAGYPWYMFALTRNPKSNPNVIFDAYHNRRSQSKSIVKYLTDEGKDLLVTRTLTQKNIFLEKYKNWSGSALTRFMLFEISYQLQFSQLFRVDRMLMASSIEGRVPFLYDDLLYKSLQLPDNLKIREKKILQFPRLRNDKISLAEAVKGIIPLKILQREKFGAQGTANLYQSIGMEQIDKTFENICCGSKYAEVRSVLSRLLDWNNLIKLSLNAKEKLFICLLCICTNQFVIGKEYCEEKQGFEISCLR
jgi:asparagine synthase (glutamine-hydrolysing)